MSPYNDNRKPLRPATVLFGVLSFLGILVLGILVLAACVSDEGDSGDFRVCRDTCTAVACLDEELWCYDECGNAHHRVAVCSAGCEDGACLDADGDLEDDDEEERKALYEVCAANSECDSGWCYPMPGDPSQRFCTTTCRFDDCTGAELQVCHSRKSGDYIEPEGGCGLGTCCYLLETERTTEGGCGGGADRHHVVGVCAYPAFTQ